MASQVLWEESSALQGTEWHRSESNQVEASVCQAFITHRERMMTDRFVDSDDCFATYMPPVRVCTHDMDLQIPAWGLSFKGSHDIDDFFLQVRRSIPDLILGVHEVTLSHRAAEFTFTVSGTQVQPYVPTFPVGKSVAWKLVSSVVFNEAGLLTSECVNVKMDPCASLLPPVSCGLEQWAHILVLTKMGSRLLEQAIEYGASPDLQGQLRGMVVETALSFHGNHTLQKYIAAVKPEAVQFIVDEFRGQTVALAQSLTAGRILQKLLQHCPWEQVVPLVTELLEAVPVLVGHRHGNFTVQKMLEHGDAIARERTIDALCACDAKFLARHWIASHVLRCAVVHAPPEARRRLVQAIAPDAQQLAKLCQHKHGSFVAHAIKHADKATATGTLRSNNPAGSVSL